jgi:hypothetical protein
MQTDPCLPEHNRSFNITHGNRSIATRVPLKGEYIVEQNSCASAGTYIYIHNGLN